MHQLFLYGKEIEDQGKTKIQHFTRKISANAKDYQMNQIQEEGFKVESMTAEQMYEYYRS